MSVDLAMLVKQGLVRQMQLLRSQMGELLDPLSEEQFWRFHHFAGHNLFFGLLLSAGFAAFSSKRTLCFFAYLTCFPLHLLMDYFGSGPGWRHGSCKAAWAGNEGATAGWYAHPGWRQMAAFHAVCRRREARVAPTAPRRSSTDSRKSARTS